jgi:hypothetical protein
VKTWALLAPPRKLATYQGLSLKKGVSAPNAERKLSRPPTWSMPMSSTEKVSSFGDFFVSGGNRSEVHIAS